MDNKHYRLGVDVGGKHRGGNGVHIVYRFLEPGKISIHDDRWLTYPWGVNGGEPGGRSTKELESTDGRRSWIPSKCDRVKVEAGDVLHFNTWSGGGWGDPLDRPAEQVAADAARGLVSREGARRYGVVLNEDLTVTEEETNLLRKKTTTTAMNPSFSSIVTAPSNKSWLVASRKIPLTLR